MHRRQRWFRKSSRGSAYRSRVRRGFTLIEASLTTVIIGTGVLAIIQAQTAYHIKNEHAVRSNTGHLLANEIRELTYGLPHHDPVTGEANYGPEAGELAITDYDDLDDFAGVVTAGIGAGITLNPPINAAGVALPDMGRWTQVIKVGNLYIDQINIQDSAMDLIPLGSTDVMRVSVTVFYTENSGALTRVAQLTWAVPKTP